MGSTWSVLAYESRSYNYTEVERLTVLILETAGPRSRTQGEMHARRTQPATKRKINN